MSGDTTIRYVGDDEAFVAALETALAEATSSDWTVERVSPDAVGDDPDVEGVACVLVEDDPPTTDGVELARRVRDGDRNVPVVLVGDHVDSSRIEAATDDGAVEYAPKTTAAIELVVGQVQAALRDPTLSQRADWYRTVVEQSSTDLLVVDEEGRRKYVTPGVAERTGYPAAELEGGDQFGDVHPEDRASFRTALDEVAAGPTGASTTVQYRVRHADGDWHTYESTLTNRLADPVVEGIVVNAREITERRRLRDELEDVYGRVTDAFFALDSEWRFTYVNEHAQELLDRTEDELLGESVWEVFSEAVGTTFQREYERAMDAQESVTFESYYDPLDTWFSVRAYPSESGLSVYFRDVTGRKQFEQTLTALYDSARELLGAKTRTEVSEVVVETVVDVLDIPGCVTYLYDDGEDHLYPAAKSIEAGFMRDELPSIPPDDSSITGHVYATDEPHRFEDVTESEYMQDAAETEMRAGIFVPLRGHGVLVVGSRGRGAFDDRTQQVVELLAANAGAAYDRVERERDLRQYETIVETVGDGVYVLDEDSRFTMANEAYLELIGYTREELLGTHSSAVTGGDLFEEASDIQERLREGGQQFATLETELPTADGSRVPVEATITLFPLGDGEYGRVGVVRDISARRRFERTLASLHDATRGFLRDETREAVAERIVATASEVLELEGVGVYLADDDGVLRGVAHSEYVEDLFGDLSEYEFGPEDTSLTRTAFDRGETLTFDDIRETDLAYEEDTPVRSGIWIPLADHGAVGVLSEEVGAFDDDDQQLVELLAATAEASLDRVERDAVQERRRAKLARLNEFSQALTEAETVEAACRSTVEAASETLDLPISVVEGYDESAGGLQPIAQTPAVTDIGGGPLFTADRDPVWQAYVDSEGVVYDDLLAELDISPDETELRSAIIMPLGEHGVFISGATEPHAFSEDDVSLATILAANTRAALDRVAREQTLRERTAELEEQAGTLQRLNRINGLVRNLTQALIQSTSREEIENAVCTQLVQADPYQFVWIGDTAPGGDVRIRASAGDDGGYLDVVSLSTEESEADEPPSTRALRTNQVSVENTIHTTPPLAPWRQETLSSGVQSKAAIPLQYRDSTYGVLVVHATEQGVFTDLELAVLRELGEMVGYAINALEQRKALVSDSVVELEFAIADLDIPALEFVQETDARFEFETFLYQSDGSLKVLFTVAGVDPEVVTAFGEELDDIGTVSLVTERDDGHLFETTTSHQGFLGQMLEYGAQVTELTASDGEGRVVVELPVSSDVRTFIEMFLTSYEGTELLARRELDHSIQTDEQFEATYRDRLTERQEEVLQTAYASGYFEWPREVTGEEVASMLGVSQPTVNRHIRTSQRKLFDLVFGDE